MDEQLGLFELTPTREDDELPGVVHRLRMEGDDPGAWPRLGPVPPPLVRPEPECTDWRGRCLRCQAEIVGRFTCEPCARAVIHEAAIAAGDP